MATAWCPLTRMVIERLNAEIARLGLTQPVMAARTGIDQSEISKILGGKRKNPSLSHLDALARCVGCTLSGLLADELPPAEWSTDVLRVAVSLEALPEADPARMAVVALATKAARGRTRKN